MKILAFTTDVPPIPGLPTSGTALRTFGLIQGLRAHGHEVTVSVPRDALLGLKRSLDLQSLPDASRRELDALTVTAFDAVNQSSVISDCGPDAVLCGHWPAMTLTTKPSQALIIDLAGPHMLERHYQQAPHQQSAMLGKLAALANADYFIVSGPKQRLYFLAYLMRAAVEQPERRILQITMPLDPRRPAPLPSGAEHPQLVFGGVFLPWQNPAAALRHVAAELTSRERGRLTLIGGKHPSYALREGVYTELFAELSSNPRVETLPMQPYEEFVRILGSMDAAVDLMEWNLERELAVTIRSTTYLWAGVPVIYNDFADLSLLIRRYDAGWCVEPGNHEALAAICREVFENPEAVARKSANAGRLADEMFSWDRAVAPLLDFLTPTEVKRVRETDIIYDFPDSAELPVFRGSSVEQYFVCRIDGLTKVEWRLATHNRRPSRPLAVRLFELEGAVLKDGALLTKGTRKLLAAQEVPGDKISNNEWSALDVAPVADSAGRVFMLQLETEEMDPAACVSPWAVKGSPYPLLELHYGSRRLDHSSLCFRTTCTGTSASQSAALHA